jgi:hypothetical protein
MPNANAQRRLVDRLVDAWLRRGLALGSRCTLRVLEQTGGRLHSVPAYQLEAGDRRWLVTASDDAGWLSGAREGGWAILSRGTRSEIVQLVSMDPRDMLPVLREFVRRTNGWLLLAARPSVLPGNHAHATTVHPIFEVIAGPHERGAERGREGGARRA